jgi:hypothetical protein
MSQGFTLSQSASRLTNHTPRQWFSMVIVLRETTRQYSMAWMRAITRSDSVANGLGLGPYMYSSEPEAVSLVVTVGCASRRSESWCGHLGHTRGVCPRWELVASIDCPTPLLWY